MKQSKPVTISREVAAKCSGPDQFEKFDALVGKIFSLSAKRSDEIRGEASVNPNPRGSPRKTSPAPGASLRA
jgi:hypothetical protein